MSETKKRKADTENRCFNENWCLTYLICQFQNKVLCLLCNENIAAFKEYNIRRHYETKHGKSKYASLTGKLREDAFNSLKNGLRAQQNIFKKAQQGNEAALRASFKVVHLLARAGKPFTDGELIKSCIVEAVQELCPDKTDLFKTISLSANTVARRTEDIGNNVSLQLQERISKFEWFSLALDESTDVSATAQLLLFLRGVDKNFKITEELVELHSLKGTITGEDIFIKVNENVN